MARSCLQIPASANKERRDINVGSCTWVVDRKCPDENIGFYLFTRKNMKDRQYIHIDVNSKTSNISLSYFDRRHPVKIIIHGYNSDMFLQPLIVMKDGKCRWNYLRRELLRLWTLCRVFAEEWFQFDLRGLERFGTVSMLFECCSQYQTRRCLHCPIGRTSFRSRHGQHTCDWLLTGCPGYELHCTQFEIVQNTQDNRFGTSCWFF